MTDAKDAYPAQTEVFCTELQRHVGLLDADASAHAARLRVQMGLRGPARNPALLIALQEQLREVAVERRRLLDMLDAMGHSYPCAHPVRD